LPPTTPEEDKYNDFSNKNRAWHSIRLRRHLPPRCNSCGAAWKLRNKREEKIEAERKAGLIERGFGPKGTPLNEEKVTGDADIISGY